MLQLTKHPEITYELLARIKSHRYGRRLPSVRELSSEFHVSSRTMQKALTKLISGNWLNPEGRRGNQINYDKSVHQKSGVICVFTNQCTIQNDPLIGEFQRLIETSGYKVMLVDLPDLEQMRQYDVVSRMPVDGFIFLYSTSRYQLCETLTLAEIPFVCCNRLPDGFPGAWCDFDYLPVYRKLVNAVFDSGFHCVAIHDLPRFSGRSDGLIKIWKVLMEERNVPRRFRFPVLGKQSGAPLEEDLKSHVRQWFERRDKPEVILCNSGHSVFFRKYLKEQYHLSVPRDVKLVEVLRDNSEVPLPEGVIGVSVSNPYTALANVGWRLFLQQLAGGGAGNAMVESDVLDMSEISKLKI